MKHLTTLIDYRRLIRSSRNDSTRQNSMSRWRILILIYGLLIFVAGRSPCALPASGAEPPHAMAKDQSAGELTLISAKRIWNEAPHNAFTSLIRFNGKWYCAFREAKGHQVSAGPGRIQVIVSNDGEHWKSAALLSEAGVDIRDAHLSITPENELMLLTGRAVIVNGVNKFHSAVQFSKDGANWSDPVTVGDPDFWLWSATWHEGVCYTIGYGTASNKMVRLYRSTDGRNFQTLVADLGLHNYPNESSIVFDNDNTAYCLLRASGPAYFGSSKPPYTNWNWVSTGVPVGGPNLVHLPDGRWLAAGRHYSKAHGSRTAVWWVDPETRHLTLALDLPSGGDCSYPGMVWHDGVLWLSYYSSHEGRTSIYLAKVAVSDPQTHQASLEQELQALKTNAEVVRFTASRRKLASDPYRPLYHFSAPEGLLNDPNGFCEWRGKYHLFYQLYPFGSHHVMWAHTYSDDLVHWKDLPLAITTNPENNVASGQTLLSRTG